MNIKKSGRNKRIHVVLFSKHLSSWLCYSAIEHASTIFLSLIYIFLDLVSKNFKSACLADNIRYRIFIDSVSRSNVITIKII